MPCAVDFAQFWHGTNRGGMAWDTALIPLKIAIEQCDQRNCEGRAHTFLEIVILNCGMRIVWEKSPRQ